MNEKELRKSLQDQIVENIFLQQENGRYKQKTATLGLIEEFGRVIKGLEVEIQAAEKKGASPDKIKKNKSLTIFLRFVLQQIATYYAEGLIWEDKYNKLFSDMMDISIELTETKKQLEVEKGINSL